MQVKADWQTQILSFFASRKQLFISLFWFVYLAIAGILLFGMYQIISIGPYSLMAYKTGVMSGQLALLLLGVVVMPGILGRFRIQIKVTRILTLFRRQLGITVFLLAFTHYMLVRFTQSLSEGLMQILSYNLRETLGLIALIILFFLFLTSNNWSISHLKIWWDRLHQLIYIILWLVVLHVALYRSSKWVFIIFTVAILEVTSLVYDWLLKRNPPPPATQVPQPPTQVKDPEKISG